MAAPVNVLAVIDAERPLMAAASALTGVDTLAAHDAMRAAVAELIAADKEYDSAEVAWDALDTRSIGDFGDPRDYDGPEYKRLCAAISRRASAIVRIGGSP